MIITINDDFDLRKIADSGQCFRVREMEDGVFRFISGEEILLIKQVDPLNYEISCDEAIWNGFWHKYFDLDRNYAKIRESIDPRDDFLLKASTTGKGIRILKQDPFEMLITFIISQRKNIPAIKKNVEDICLKYGKELSLGDETLHAFPSASELKNVSEEIFREMALGYRAPYLRDAVDSVLSGRLDLTAISSLKDEELLTALQTVKGVGVKVANCIALFAYSRTALAPVDVWIARVIDNHYGGTDPFPKYGNNAGIMQQYMYFAAISEK